MCYKKKYANGLITRQPNYPNLYFQLLRVDTKLQDNPTINKWYLPNYPPRNRTCYLNNANTTAYHSTWPYQVQFSYVNSNQFPFRNTEYHYTVLLFLNWLLFKRFPLPKFCVHFSCSQSLTLRLLMSYIYGAPTLDVSRSHTTTQHSR